MKQFLLSKEPDNTGHAPIVRLEGDDYRYLVRVRRLAVGEYFPALLPSGEETLIKIISIDKHTLTGECTQNPSSPNPPLRPPRSLREPSSLPPIILYQALPKGEKMDLIARQAAEGGITEIVPFVSQFSVAKAGTGGQKFSRWERVIKEARQQSGSKTATKINRVLTIEGLFEHWEGVKEGSLGLLFHHEGLAQNSLHGYLDIMPKAVVLAVGPEGGFSASEAALFMEKGFKPITIGDTILRTETAALYCAAAVRVLLLEKDSWELKQAK